MSLVSLNHVTYHFSGASIPAVDDVSCTIEQGDHVAIVGQSGSGKTTLLNIALGFLHPTSGEVLPANPSTTGLVFQNPASSLDPRWTVERLVREGKPDASFEEIAQSLQNVNLEFEEIRHRFVTDISGGQAQRVALARALISQPQLLVADEPVSAVDVLGKQQIITTIQQIQKSNKTASIIVLHDLGVAQKLSNRLIVLHQGKIVEQGDTQSILSHPQHEYTQHLIEAAQW